MSVERSMRKACRRFVAAGMAAVCLMPGSNVGRAAAAPPFPAGEAATHSSSSSVAEAVSRDRACRDALPSVFLVETESWRGIGFLIDSSGLILTAPTAALPARFLAVTIAPGEKVLARPVKVSRSAFGIIRVHPETVAGLRPLRIVGAGEGADPPVEGEGLMAILLSPEGGFTRETGTVTKVGGWYLRADMPVPPEPGSCDGCPDCGPGRFRCATALVLDSRGRVLGMDPVTEMRRKPRTQIRRLRISGEHLAAALAEAEKTPPPAPAPLPTPPATPYPREARDRLAAAIPDPGPYQTRAGPFLVEFLTPLLARAGGDPAEGSEAVAQVACSRPRGNLDRWRPGFSDESPVVTVRVIPEIRRRAGTYFGVTLFWILSPVIYVALACGGVGSPPSPPHVSSRFDPPIGEIELLRGGRRVEPLYPRRVCGGRPLLRIDLCSPESRQREKRRVKGCYLAYTYPAEAFAPGQPMELRITREEEGADTESVNLEEALIQRVWSDFQPYFEVAGVQQHPGR